MPRWLWGAVGALALLGAGAAGLRAASPVVNSTVAIVDANTPVQQAAVSASGALSVSVTTGVSSVTIPGTVAVAGEVRVTNTPTVGVNSLPPVIGSDSAHVNAARFLTVQGGHYIDPVGAVGINSSVGNGNTNNVIAKAGAGSLWGVYATNATSTSGNVIVINSTTVPADGAISAANVLDCVPLPPLSGNANGVGALSYRPGPPKVYATGITVVLSSASSCYTKTTGVITGFISVDVQ